MYMDLDFAWSHGYRSVAPVLQEWDGLLRICFVRKNKTLSAIFRWVLCYIGIVQRVVHCLVKALQRVLNHIMRNDSRNAYSTKAKFSYPPHTPCAIFLISMPAYTCIAILLLTVPLQPSPCYCIPAEFIITL